MVSINEIEIKKVNNVLCGTRGCTRSASRKVFFPIGFSANFCEECTKALTDDNIGRREDVEG